MDGLRLDGGRDTGTDDGYKGRANRRVELESNKMGLMIDEKGREKGEREEKKGRSRGGQGTMWIEGNEIESASASLCVVWYAGWSRCTTHETSSGLQIRIRSRVRVQQSRLTKGEGVSRDERDVKVSRDGNGRRA